MRTILIVILIATCIIFGVAHQKEATMTQHAIGTFEVKLTPQPLSGQSDPNDKSIGHMSGEKQFHGDLEGTSRVEMLSAGSPEKGSAGYVAMERVTGTLKGRSGTFILQHSGTMNHGALELSVTVVPDSGAGQLAGLSGKMTINIVNGKHFYDFEYTLPETR
jgi:hypothetical protein